MSESSVELNILTFNTGNDLIAPESLIDVISRSNADIVGLEELSPRNATALEKALLSEYPRRVLFGKKFDGKGLLSRYPIETHRMFSAHITRPHIEAILNIGGRKAAFYVVHSPAPNYRRLELESRFALPEIKDLIRLLQADVPTILAGDFNFTDRSRLYRHIAQAGFIDTFKQVGHGPGLTFPTRFEHWPIPLPRLFRIDYIWVTHQFRPLSSMVSTGDGSDHLPVISRVALGGE